MNSSTKPPLTTAPTRKFQFDMDFEVEEERLRVESLRQHEQEAHQVEEQHITPAQIFSEEEMQRLRDEALQNGLRQGRMETLQEIEQSVALLVNAMVDKMEILLDAEQKRAALAQEIAIKTTMQTIKKIWPQILQKCGMEMIENTIRQSMDNNNEEPRIVVRVHDTMLDTIVKRLPQLQEQQAFAGKVIVIADENIVAGDCKIEWADGGLDRLSRTLSKQLDAALDRILSAFSAPTQTNNGQIIELAQDPERTNS